MIARRVLLGSGLSLAAGRALAIDPGVASGRYARDGVSFGFAHAVALRQDNAEGMLDSPTRMRVAVSEAELPVSALYGLAFPPVWGMARAGAVRGLLIHFDPADGTSLTATVLALPEPGFSLPTLSLSSSEGLWSRLDVAATRVTGQLKPDASEGLTLSFSAPVFHDAVEADIRGPAAQASEPVKVLIARAEAIGRGDLAAAIALSTEASAANLKAAPPEALPQFRKYAPELIRRLKAARRVVVRRETAAVLLGPGEWSSVARVNGAWRAAD